MNRISHKLILGGFVGLMAIGGGGAYALSHNQSSQERGKTTISSVVSDAVSSNDSDVDWAALPTKNVTLSNETLSITAAGTYVLTGSTNAGILVNTDGNVRLVLSGATIKSTSGPALYVQSAKNAYIELASGTTNTIEDTTNHPDTELDGALYSADDLVLTGSGSLTVNGKYGDAVVSKDDLKITGGTYTITSTDDGVRGTDSVSILGGSLTITAGGDGVKSTNETDATKGFVYIKEGKLSITAGDDGVHATSQLVVDGGTIQVSKSVEGMEATNITINGGSLDINASDDGINATTKITGLDVFLKTTGGNVTVAVGQGDTDGLDSNGDVMITGGTVTITAPTAAPASSIDYNGTATLSGGTLVINGTQVSEIPAQQMGGPGNMR